MTEGRDLFEYGIKGSQTSSGRFIRTSCSTMSKEFVLITDEVYQDIRLHIIGDRPIQMVGLSEFDILAIKECCDLFLAEHKRMEKKA